MESEKIRNAMKEALEIINDSEIVLEDDLKQIAFEVILRKLLEDTEDDKKYKPPIKQIVQKPSKKSDESIQKSDYADEILNQNMKRIIQDLRRTKYPLVKKLEGSKDLAFYILKIVKDDLDIDGLTSSQIVEILTKKFNLEKDIPTADAITKALKRATEYVELVPLKTSFGRGGKTIKAMIAPAGEDYIDKILEELREDE